MDYRSNKNEGSYTWFREVRAGSNHTSRLTIGVPALRLQISNDVTLYAFKEGDIFGATTHKVVKKGSEVKEYKSYTVVQVRKDAASSTEGQKTYPGCVVLLEAKGEEDVNLVSTSLGMMSSGDINSPSAYKAISILVDAFKLNKGEERARYLSDVLEQSATRGSL